MRQEKDRAEHWLVQHFSDLIVRLVGAKNVAACRALKGDVVAPRRFPDGLIEVTFTDRPDKAHYLIELETYADPDADRQMFEDLMALALDRRPLPTSAIVVLRPKGNAKVQGHYEVRSEDGSTRLVGGWQVVEVWKMQAPIYWLKTTSA